jgi:hypothetical protein
MESSGRFEQLFFKVLKESNTSGPGGALGTGSGYNPSKGEIDSSDWYANDDARIAKLLGQGKVQTRKGSTGGKKNKKKKTDGLDGVYLTGEEDEEKQKGVDGKACWKGYRRVGTKKKGGKTVDNCVKVEDEEAYDEDAERVDKDRMKCNSPRRTSGGSKKFVVKACKDGKEKIVRYGDPNMKIKKSNPKRRKSFRARHKCDQKKDKFSAGYWSCKKW